MVYQAYSYAGLPPMLTNARFRSILLAWVLLVLTAATLLIARSWTTNEGDSYYTTYIPSPRKWASAWGQLGNADSPMLHSLQALQWKGDHPGAVDKFEESSLERWTKAPGFTEPEYDPEPNHRPHNGTYKAGVVWLSRRQKLLDTLASLESLARYVPMDQAYAFILMHSGDLANPDIQDAFRRRWFDRADELAADEGGIAAKMRVMGEYIEFLEINMDAPTDVARRGKDGMKGELDEVVFGGVWPGYHSMCRFFATNIFWNPRIRQLDYYMRMDTDSYILTPMLEDPFRRIQRSGASYAFRQPGGDPDFVVHGMADFIDDYAKKHPAEEGLRARIDQTRIVDSSRKERNGGFGAYYNNWEIAHVPSFRRPGVAEWLATLVKNDVGFYRYRWGDAPLRYATVKMFFDDSEVDHFCDFTYYHQFLMKEGKLVGDEWKCN